MRTWLTNHAINNVWAKPNLDNQMVVELPRISTPDLARLRFMLSGINYNLPTNTHPYSVYDLGNFHPERGELNVDYSEGWVLLTDLINRTGASFFFYNIDGLIYPTSKIYIMRTISDRFIVAVRQENNLFNLGKFKLYAKLYDHHVKRIGGEVGYWGVKIESMDMDSVYTIHNFITRYHVIKNKNRFATMVVNGERIKNPTTSILKIGDICEIVSDDTIVKTVTFTVGDLPAFFSELDSCKKYLLHIPKDGKFQYIDDMELFVTVNGVGRYYHRHNRQALTQLTHGDFAISTKQINEYSVLFEEWSNVKVEMVIRESGIPIELTYNHNRIHELYRLDDTKIINVMTGLNSHLPFWQASNLEKSSVNYLRSSSIENITHKLVSDSYGYNAAIYYSANTPNKATVGVGGLMVATLPPLMAKDSMVYEYDSGGRLLGWWRHLSGPYTCRRSQTTLVEAIPGRGGETLDIITDAEEYLIDRYSSYRYYLQRVVDNSPRQEYLDVTGTDAYYIDDAFRVRWSYDKTRYRPVILTDKYHLVNKQIVSANQGLIRVGVTHSVDGGTYPVPFKFATVEVFLNSRPLVYGVDYQVDWPAITVTNKTYLIPGGEQEVVVRARVPAAEITPPKTGFIIHGMLSENSQYDIKDDKVIRIVYGGGIHHRDDVVFREDVYVGVDGNYDGLPYSVDSVAISAGNLLEGSYASRREESLERDELVEKFMTIHYPNDILDNIQPIESRYPVYSPVMNKMINDVQNGDLVLVDDDVNYRISTQQLDKIMKGYEYLLPTDPAFIGYDEWFVVVDPHWGFGDLEVPALLYTLLERVNHRYFKSRVELTRYLTIRND